MMIQQATHKTYQPIPTQSKAPASPKPEASVGSVVRDVAAISAGTVAGTAGAVYGFGEGLIVNGIQNYPTHVSKGAEIGSKILTPVGGAVGAITTGAVVAANAVITPVATVLAATVGTVAGTLASGAQQAPSAIKETAKKGAEVGANVGKNLGAVGETVGKYVGAAVGGVAGIGVALAGGVPAGLELGKSIVKEGYDEMKALPTTAKETWNTLYPAGRNFAGGVGAFAGGSTGLVSATAETGIEALSNSVKRAGQWGKVSHDFVAGKKAETTPPETPKQEAQA